MRTAKLGALFLSALLLGAGAGAYSNAATNEPSRTEEVAEGEIAQRINSLRAQYLPQAPRLLYDPELVAIARARSRAIADGKAPFAHEDRPGHFPAIEMAKERFGPYNTIGENLFAEGRGTRAFDAAAFAKRTVEEWMASQEHHDNIVSPDFTTTGIGVVVIGDRAYATEIFRGPPPPAQR
jgi:uncharacterized protein YkwD